jgi:hypothetical protein
LPSIRNLPEVSTEAKISHRLKFLLLITSV